MRRIALLMALLVGPGFTTSAFARPHWGDVRTTGLVAMTCEVDFAINDMSGAVADQVVEKVFHLKADNPVECHPFLSPLESPDRLFGASKAGDVFVFTELPPGTYRLTSIQALDHEPKDDKGNVETTTRWFTPIPSDDRALVVTVRAGEVAYLGALEVSAHDIQSGSWSHSSDEHWSLAWSAKKAHDALEEVRKKLRKAPWEPILAKELAGLSVGTLPDTTLAWSQEPR